MANFDEKLRLIRLIKEEILIQKKERKPIHIDKEERIFKIVSGVETYP